jgi:hypothetical protein
VSAINPDDAIPNMYDGDREGCEECGAQPGERCGPFCTSYDGTDQATSADMVRVSDDLFAVRFCPRCGGSGRDRGAPNSAWTWSSTADAEGSSPTPSGDQDDTWCQCVRTEEDVTALHLAELSAPALDIADDSTSD